MPEFFILLGIDVFLAISFVGTILGDLFPSRLQYLFPLSAIAGLGQLVISEEFINIGLFSRDPTDPTRFWLSTAYLGLAVSSVVALNFYLAVVRRKTALASVFSGTVTLPTFVTSAVFVSSFIGSGGEVTFTIPAVVTLVVAALIMSLSLFGFLREAFKHIINKSVQPSLSRAGLVSTTTEAADGPSPAPPATSQISTPLRLTHRSEDDWEESPTKKDTETRS